MKNIILSLRRFIGQYKDTFKYYKLQKYITNTYDPCDVSLLKTPNVAIKFIQQCIYDASREYSKLATPDGERVLDIHGMSSNINRHLLNNLCSLNNANYLEVGVWLGATFISAGYKNNIKMVAIDNWSKFNGPHDDFKKNCETFLNNGIFKQYNIDSFVIDPLTIGKSFDIYFYDGDHSYESQYKAFTHFNPILKDTFITIIDDYNSDCVQKGTQAAFKKLNYNILFETKLLTSENSDTSSWWNGLYVGLIQKPRV